MNKLTRILASSLAAVAISLPYAKAEEKKFIESSHATFGLGYAISGPSLDLRFEGSVLDIENPHKVGGKSLYDRIMVDGDFTLGMKTEPFARVNVSGAFMKELHLPFDDGGTIKYASYARGALEAGIMLGGGSDINIPGTHAGKFFFYAGPRHGFSFIKEKGIDADGSFGTSIGKSGTFFAYADFPVIGVSIAKEEYSGLFGGAARTGIETSLGHGFGTGASLDMLALTGKDGFIIDSNLDIFMKRVSEKNIFADRFMWGVRWKLLNSGSFSDTGCMLFIGIEG